jgi:membrane protein implicated in regulation of membrane protease activity
MPAALIWLVVALGLAGAEALTGDLFLLMLGGGALAAAGTAAVFDWPIWADGVVFLVVSILLLGLVRPALRRRFTSAPALETGPEALEGKPALVLDRVSQHQGQIKLEGEVWTARPLNDHDIYEPGDQVTVMRIDGATAVVWKNA